MTDTVDWLFDTRFELMSSNPYSLLWDLSSEPLLNNLTWMLTRPTRGVPLARALWLKCFIFSYLVFSHPCRGISSEVPVRPEEVLVVTARKGAEPRDF